MLKTYHSLRVAGIIISIVIGLFVSTKVHGSLSRVNEAVKESTETNTNTRRSRRTQRRSWMIVWGGAALGGGLAGLACWGLTMTGLGPIEKKLRWSIYRVVDEQKTLVAEDLSHEDMVAKKSQLELNEGGSEFESVPTG